MKPTAPSAVSLADRLCRPQRIGVFGHRGVGKTTFLTMLYREAVGGRLPDLRLAAADAPTANYLADKILQLEGGEVLPATLAESELRFQLYHKGARVELVVKDYQGEHVEVGREEPIRDFLRDCDAVLLCLDPALLTAPQRCLRGQQEVEQLVEDYLALEPQGTLHRPMALVLTKADLLPPPSPPAPLPPGERGDNPTPLSPWGRGAGGEGQGEKEWLTGLVREHFSMAAHALKEHSPTNDLFAVSSLGPRDLEQGSAPPRPQDLDRPLLWLAEALYAQDEARMERLWAAAGRKLPLLEKCVACFVRRYPNAPKAAQYQKRLREQVRHRRRQRGLLGAAVAGCLALGVVGYDGFAYHQAKQFDRESDNLEAVRDRWQGYVASPLSIGSKAEAEKRLREVEEQIRQRDFERALADLRRRADDRSSDPAEDWETFVAFHDKYPDTAGLDEVRAKIEQRLKPKRDDLARRAFDELEQAENKLPRSSLNEAARQRLEGLAAHANRLLEEYGDTSLASTIRQRRDLYLRRIDRHDFDLARAYSRLNPLSFQTRVERYKAYLDRHPEGHFAREARVAVAAVESAWDKHDFRAVRDLYVEKPAALKELTARCERYLLVHRAGRFRAAARELIRWCEKVSGEREYMVVADAGSFTAALGRWYTKGPDLSVEIEVAGVKYGPSNFIKNNYHPEWGYEFPRPVRWKLGDRVTIRINDHDFWDRVVAETSSGDDDLLAMRMLSGEVRIGAYTLWFRSDFPTPPTLPKIE